MTSKEQHQHVDMVARCCLDRAGLDSALPPPAPRRTWQAHLYGLKLTFEVEPDFLHRTLVLDARCLPTNPHNLLFGLLQLHIINKDVRLNRSTIPIPHAKVHPGNTLCTGNVDSLGQSFPAPKIDSAAWCHESTDPPLECGALLAQARAFLRSSNEGAWRQAHSADPQARSPSPDSQCPAWVVAPSYHYPQAWGLSTQSGIMQQVLRHRWQLSSQLKAIIHKALVLSRYGAIANAEGEA